MNIVEINSHKELNDYLNENENNYVLIFKNGSEKSDCALSNIKQIENIKNVKIFSVDVSKVKDIHSKYDIKTAPTLLQFEKNKLTKTIKGCNSTQYYKSLFENSLFSGNSKNEKETYQKPITVYSTPSCSWCKRLKKYLQDNKIKYKDIDVSKDKKAAEQMVKRSGQQGVPQTNIGGQIIIGFDKSRIDQLLNIKT